MTTTTPATVAPQAAAPAWGSAVGTGAGDVGIDFAALLFALGASPESGVSAEAPIAVDARDAADIEPDEAVPTAPLPVWPLEPAPLSARPLEPAPLSARPLEPAPLSAWPLELPPLPASVAPLPAATEPEAAVAMPASLLAQAARAPAAATIAAAGATETVTLPEPASAAPLPAPAMAPVAPRGAARSTFARDAGPAASGERTDAPPTVSAPSLPSFSAAPEHAARDTMTSLAAPATAPPPHSSSAPMMTSPAYPAPAPALAAIIVAAPLGRPEFAPALAAQVTVLARDGIQHAELKLNPVEMGPIAVRIEVTEGTLTTVHFAADVAATRDVLEASLPELAGALREAGLTLVGGGVSQNAQQSHHGRRDAGGAAQGDRRHEGREGDAGADPHAQAPRRSRGVVDLVA